MLYPVVPHTTWVLWRELGFADALGDLLDAPWPQVDPAALAQDEIELVLQVNGKLRGKIVVPANADNASDRSAARASAEVAKHSERAAGEEGHHRSGKARQCRGLARPLPRWSAALVAQRSRACGFHLRGDGDLSVRLDLRQRAVVAADVRRA